MASRLDISLLLVGLFNSIELRSQSYEPLINSNPEYDEKQ